MRYRTPLTKHKRFKRSFKLSKGDVRLPKLFRQTVPQRWSGGGRRWVACSLDDACSTVSGPQSTAASSGDQRTFVSYVRRSSASEPVPKLSCKSYGTPACETWPAGRVIFNRGLGFGSEGSRAEPLFKGSGSKPPEAECFSCWTQNRVVKWYLQC